MFFAPPSGGLCRRNRYPGPARPYPSLRLTVCPAAPAAGRKSQPKEPEHDVDIFDSAHRSGGLRGRSPCCSRNGGLGAGRQCRPLSAGDRSYGPQRHHDDRGRRADVRREDFQSGRIGRRAVRAGDTLLAVVKADSSGEASGSVTIPRRTPTGSYSFSLTGSESGLYLSAIINVTGLPGGPGGGPGHHYRPGYPGHYSFPGFPWLPGFTVFADDARAGSAPVNVDTVPVVNHVKEPENAKGRALAVAGAAAALGAFGGGTYLMRRRRRG